MFGWMFLILIWIRDRLGGVKGGTSTDWDPTTSIPDLARTVSVVTGVSVGGIGYETAKELYSHGSHVYLACRNESKAVASIASIERESKSPTSGSLTFIPFDLTDLKSCYHAAEILISKETRLDIVVANAGVMACPYKLIDGIELQFYNHLGHHAFIQPLIPLLLKTLIEVPKKSHSSRIVILSSVGHLMASRPNFENQKLVTDQLLPLGTTSRYAQSKLCNILHALSLQHYFQPLNPASPTPNIKVFSVHPGPVATGLYAGPTASWPFIRRFIEFAAPYFLLTPKEGANTVLFAAAGKEVDERRIASGTYFVPFAKIGKPSKLAQDEKLATELWELSGKLVRERV